MRDNSVPNWIYRSCNHRLLISETWFLPATLTTRPAQPFSTPPISRSLSLFCILEEMLERKDFERLSNTFSSWFCPGRLVQPVQGRGDSIGQLLCEARPDQDGQLHEPGMNIFRRNMLTWSLIDNSLARDWNCLVTAKSFDKSFSFSHLLCCWQWFMIILSPKKKQLAWSSIRRDPSTITLARSCRPMLSSCPTRWEKIGKSWQIRKKIGKISKLAIHNL